MLTLALATATWATAQPQPAAHVPAAIPEVRGTWLTTTANDALASPANTAATMRALREIGLNTVYVETWKNGYTQYPSDVLARTIGVSQRPSQAAQDPSDSAAQRATSPRDLLHEACAEAHRQGLICMAWFEYGFMAAHASTMTHLRRLKPEWLSRDASGNEVAPNGFVWMNPLHPQARLFLLDLLLEAIDRYDIDGVQIDDRIVWPYVTMGYDDFTVQAYAAEHQGAKPPTDARDPAWMRWRAAKVDETARWFTQELRARRPGLVLSLSPAVYPWSWEHYLLNWPRWAAWGEVDRLRTDPVRGEAARATLPHWDEFIPQAYRFSYAAFAGTWLEQMQALRDANPYRARDLVAGIRINGGGDDSSWAQLRDSMALVREHGQGGHVLWFSRGVLGALRPQLTAHYAALGPARSPRFPAHWRPAPINLQREPTDATAANDAAQGQREPWIWPSAVAGDWRVIGHDGLQWQTLQTLSLPASSAGAKVQLLLPRGMTQVELLADRRAAMRQSMACRAAANC